MKNDLISRKAAIRWVKTECNPYGKPTLDYESGKRVMKHLEQMPSAKPEREKGHWISKMRLFAGKDYMQCSKCGGILDLQCLVGYPYFCHNCGAEMREGE